MTSILTPQEICELDTFTLEEKIEELENHPCAPYYTDILKMAKLELIDRLETEEFGRKLANDEYKIAEEMPFLPLTSKPEPQLHPNKLPPFATNRNQAAIKLQTNLLTAGSFVTIGKPAVNHHYKPKIKKVQIIEPTKNFLKAKRHNFSKGKIYKASTDKNLLVKKQQPCSIKQVKPSIAPQLDVVKPVINQVKPVIFQAKPIALQQQFSLKEKLKRQVQQMHVVFRQNDAYDDMRQIKLSPQNLLEEEIKMNEAQPISTEIEELYPQNKSKCIDQSQHIQEKQQKIEEIEQVVQQVGQQEWKTPQSIKQNDSRYSFVAQKIKLTQNTELSQKDSVIQTPYDEKCKQEILVEKPSLEMTDSADHPIINLDKLNPPASFNANKQSKSSSVRALPKPSQNYQNLMSDNIRIHKMDDFKHQKVNSIKFLKDQYRIKPEHKMTKSNYGSFKPIPPKSETFPYHEIIPTFHKLFPHSKNLLLTLRNVEENLKLHFLKQIDEKSKNNEYLKLNQNELTFKVISECEKARKYVDYFGIELDTFHQRGEVMLDRIRGDHQVSSSDIMLYRVVRTKEEVYDIINSSFHRTKEWHELPHGMELRVSWNLLWTWSKPQIDFTDLFYFQKVNHFIGNKQIARKDLLKKNIENIQKLGGKMKQFFDIIPETFLLPGENIAFIKKFREYGQKDPLNYWILKPVGLSRGRGIQLVNRLQDVVFSEPVVLQRYVSNPFLVDGYKFDMRIYVLVTSINPLQAFIYHEGFARLSTQRYSLDEDLMDNKYIHLTNFSINRENITDRKLTLQQQLGGCKISLKMLKKRLEQSGVAWEKVEKQIDQIVLKSLISCMNTIPQNPNCFQLFGYDIFMDSNLKCWLLEVNSSPSLEKEFMLDEVIKQQLVDDIMEMVCPVSYNRERLLEIVERRRKEAEGLKSSINVATNSTWQLNQDLHYILNGQKLRKYGEVRHKNFKTVAPSERYYSIVKVLQQYKIDPIIKEEK